MKKTIAIIIHILAVLVIAAGFGELNRYSKEGYGLSWMESTAFEDSVLFSEMVSDDIAGLKRYAVLRNAFEEEADGELSMNKVVASASTQNGTMHYRLSDLINQAASYGYYLDEDTYTISYSEKAGREEPYELKIIYKLYDPFYFENTSFGPTQGVTNIRDFSTDALKSLAEYYRLDAVYGTSVSNFAYNIEFDSGDDYTIMLENTDLSPNEIRNLGKYLVVNGDGVVETNIEPQPAGVLSMQNSFDFYWDEEEVLTVGVDTNYIYNDRYRQAADSFGAGLGSVQRWITAIAAAVFVGIVSLVFSARGFSAEDRRELTMDRIPLEALIFLAAVASVLLYIIFKLTVNPGLEKVFEYSDWEFYRDIAKAVIVWLCCAVIIGSMYRRSVNGGCFKNSLAAGVFNYLAGEGDVSAAWGALKGYAAFICVHIAAFAFLSWCRPRRRIAPNYTIATVICIIFLIAFDLAVYLLRYRRTIQKNKLKEAVHRLSDGRTDTRMDEAGFDDDLLPVAKDLNNISEGLEIAVNEQVKADRLKADLITNVSHDIRTPLTSIINYVDLLKRENVSDKKIREYIDVLEKKSARLKNLTEDLLEASKASSGNIKMDMQCLDIVELAGQAGGEFDDRFRARNLSLELEVPKAPVYVMADGRYLWRVFENLYGNAAKYSMEGTRVYAEVAAAGGKARFTIKNISADRLNISPDELTERFVRGDISRNTEGSGLGLSIAGSLTQLMKGELKIEIDGDLYKANVFMDECAPPAAPVSKAEEEKAKEGAAKDALEKASPSDPAREESNAGKEGGGSSPAGNVSSRGGKQAAQGKESL